MWPHVENFTILGVDLGLPHGTIAEGQPLQRELLSLPPAVGPRTATVLAV